MYQAIAPERHAGPAELLRAQPRARGGHRRRAHASPPARRLRRRRSSPRPRRSMPSTSTSALTTSTTSPWMISRQVRGQLGLEDRRVEVALRGAAEQRRRTAAPRPPCRSRCCGRAAPRRCRGSRSARSGCRWWRAGTASRARRATPARPGEQAADRHHEHVVLGDAHAAVAGRLGVEADGAHLVAGGRAVQDQPEHHHRRERDEQADVQALEHRVAPEHRQVRRLDDVVGDRQARVAVVLERAAEREQVHADPERDVVEHDRRDHLVGADGRLQQAGDPGPRRARQAGRHDRQHDVQEARHPRERRAHPHRRDRRRRCTGPGRRC